MNSVQQSIIFAVLLSFIIIIPMEVQASQGPGISALILDDPDHGDEEYSDGDTITIRFSESTNMPKVETKTDIDKLFLFSQNLGTNYVGEFTNPSTIVITIIDSTESDISNPVELGVQIMTEGNLKNYQGTSDASNAESSQAIGSFAGFSLDVPVELNSGKISAPLPFGLTMDWQFPPEVSGKVNVKSTDFEKSTEIDDQRIQKIIGAIEISPSEGANCIDGCSISFQINQNDLNYLDLSLEEIKIYRDAAGDGQFIQNEDELETEIQEISDGNYLAHAETKFNSKFAIGGVKFLALAGTVFSENDNTVTSPMQQSKNGVEPKDIECKENLELLMKKSTGQGVCIKHESKDKLIERQWGALF